MVVQSNHCDRERLQRLTEDQLEPDEINQVEQHLQSCPQCQADLEQIAGSDRWYDAARRYLGEDTITRQFGATPLVDGALDFLAPSDWPDSLGRLGTYEVKGVVGRGGMCVVLKAVDPALNRTVAIKVMAPHLAASGAARQRFLREARAAAAVVHEHVVAVHAVDESNGLPYLVMEYVPGGSLQDRLDHRGPLPITEVLRIGMQAAAGLAVAHGQGLVHRDIKPANILLDAGVERARLTDFGLARAADDANLTQSGVVTGTPQYMAPEQARAEAVDQRSDLFSLGSTLYAMCAGHPPFRAESAVAVLRRVSDDTPRPLREINANVPDWFETIVARLHAKNPDDRYQTAAEVAELLGRCLAHVQQPLTAPLPQGLESRPGRFRRLARVKRWAGIAAALALVIIAVGVIRPWQHSDTQSPAGGGEVSRHTEFTGASQVNHQPPRMDEIDEQIQKFRLQASAVEAELVGNDASNAADTTSEQIRTVQSQAKALEQDIQHGAKGAPH